METNSITIVGGGSAGWMTAATLIKNFPEKQISVIESPNVPTVGVGESTLGQINLWLYTLGIEDKDWMASCDASYKLSIKFTNFYENDNSSFHYPFGYPEGFDRNLMPEALMDWYHRKALHPELPVENFADTFYPVMSFVHNNKFCPYTMQKLGFHTEQAAAYHFDATKFGIWLRDNYCIPNRVDHIQANVESISSDETGITGLVLDNNDYEEADLYIDCTGFKSILLNELGAEFTSYSDILPNDSAWATRLPYTDKDKELKPYTNCTALGNGWVWDIPLWSRVGTGYVFSSEFTSDEDALEEFKNHLRTDRDVPVSQETIDSLEFKKIDMRVGIHDEIFLKNVCAIGLAAGFIEPLESNGLYTVHEFLHSLVHTLQRNTVSQFDKDAFNEKCKGNFRAFAEFVALHYALSIRQDTPYWKNCLQMKRPKQLPLPGFYATYGFDNLKFSHRENNQVMDKTNGIVPISAGMNWFPFDKPTMMRRLYEEHRLDYVDYLEEQFPHWDKMLERRNSAVEMCSSLPEYLKENIHHER